MYNYNFDDYALQNEQAENLVLETNIDVLPVATEPITVQEAAAFCKIEVTDDDTILGDLITAARAQCEKYTGIAFVQRSGFIAVVRNDLGGVRLPYSPINNITGVYDDTDTLLDPSQYQITGVNIKRVAYPCYPYLKIVYDNGPATLQGYLRNALLNQILWLYQNRGDAAQNAFNALSPQVQKQLSIFRIVV
jgi:uncharacterized phiE125 gp8 family phage protein